MGLKMMDFPGHAGLQ